MLIEGPQIKPLANSFNRVCRQLNQDINLWKLKINNCKQPVFNFFAKTRRGYEWQRADEDATARRVASSAAASHPQTQQQMNKKQTSAKK